MTLGRWFLLWMLMVTVLVLGISLAVITVRGHAVASQQLLDRAAAVARSVAVAADRPEAAAAAVAALPECVAVTVVENGRPVWAQGPDPTHALALDPSLVAVSQLISLPSAAAGRREVTLVLSQDGVRAQVVDSAARLALSLTVALAVTLVVGVLLVNRVVEPIKELSRRVRAFRPDEPPPPLVLGGAAEVGELGRSFDEMAERLAAQRRSLVASEHRLRQLFLAAPSPLLEIDGRLVVAGANPAAATFLGGVGEPLEGQSLSAYLDPTSAAAVAVLVAGSSDPGATIAGRWRRPAGDELEVDLQLSEVFGATRGTWLVAVHGLTERLRRMGEEWRRTFDELSDGVAVLDRAGRVVLANRAIAPYLDRLGREVAEVIDAGERCEWQLEQDGRTLRCRLLGGARDDRRILVVRDDTDWMQAEERLREAHKMAAVATLAGGVAHDFNNLLAGVLLQVRLIERGADPEGLAAGAIRALAEEGAAVVRGLIQFAQPEASPREPLDLAAVVADQEPLLRHLMPAGIEVATALAPAWVEGSRSDLRRVVLNLVVNARAALAEQLERGQRPGRVRVTVAPAGAEVVLEVVDNGPGVPLAERERIFEPFFTRRGDGRGAGLGLAVVYAVVREHGGTVAVGEGVGGGARFTVRLPRLPGGATAVGDPAEAAST